MKPSVALVPQIVEKTEELPAQEDPASPKIGKWYWVGRRDNSKKKKKDSDDDPWLGCVVHIGSNYVELRGPDTRQSSRVSRVHADHFWEKCEYVPDPENVIGARIAHHQNQVKLLMTEVRDVTAKLAITTGPELSGAGILTESAESTETRALALRSGPDQDLGKYKKALVLAQKKTLPDLFKEIEEHNDKLGVWLSASIIPLKAQADAMEPAIKAIEDRIFSVELYAGLTETVTLIKDGEPAPLSEKLHLFQRRAYMDEECLARYETGGMEFKDIRAFDAWLARPSNLYRLLPFQRSVLAFQVRRKEKEREWENLRQFLKVIDEAKTDKLTFLYLRNGEKLYRLSTEIDFDEKLFPDMEKSKLTGALYAKTWGSGSRIEKIITKDEYDALIAEEEREAAIAAEKYKTAKKEDKWQYEPWRFTFRVSSDYEPFTRESVYYDDISKFVKSEIDKHNRLVLILQGLLDRSTVFHPHPPWRLWDSGGFGQAIALVYDDTRALVAGQAPDFEVYRDALNAQIKPGSITVGQEDYWERVEAARESKRMDSNWRTSSRDWRPTHHRPEGNPGPGKLAHVTSYSPRKKTCTYEWARKRLRDSWRDDAERIACSITVPASKLLNISAYKPGDFRKFFEDPRTRADYLQWAPMLLTAEEYCAGNREVQKPVIAPKKEKSAEGARRYRRKKAREAAGGKAVRLVREIRTEGGESYPKGSLWRTTKPYRGKFTIIGIDEHGRDEPGKSDSPGRYIRYARCINGIDLSDFVIDPSVTLAPEKAGKE